MSEIKEAPVDLAEEYVEDPIEKPDTSEPAPEEDEKLLSPAIRALISKLLKYAFVLAFAGWTIAAFIHDFERAKFLFVCLCIGAAYAAFYYVASRNEEAYDRSEQALIDFLDRSDKNMKEGMIVSVVLVGIMAIIMAIHVKSSRNLISAFGYIVFVLISWLFSWKPKKVTLRPVLFGTFIQFMFGFFVIKTQWGYDAIDWVATVFVDLLNYTLVGSSFVFSWLTDGSFFAPDFFFVRADGSTFSLGPPFFFGVLPTVIFFSSLVQVLYKAGVFTFIVKRIGYFLGLLLGTSASESISMAGNIFVGQTEAPLLVRPFMPKMTDSELHAIMTGGFATVAGGVLFLYISFGIPQTAILGASIMSAPAALAISKIVYPETEESDTATGKKGAYSIAPMEEANLVHAAGNGANIGMALLLNIAANLISFLALFHMFDQILWWVGDLVGGNLSFNILCEYIFYPVAWLMGVDGDDCSNVAIVLGQKILINEFVAYSTLAFELRSEMSERSFFIASYALCGFANIGSIGIQLGGLSAMAKGKSDNLAKLVVSAMIAGNTACLLTGCIAGIFYDGTLK